MDQLHRVDLAVLLAYLAAVVGLGWWYSRSSQDAEWYMAAGRSLPAWAVGLSIFGSYISSISFLANPGKSFAGNWNAFVFSLATPVAAWVAARSFVPFYRRAGQVSAYHHLEDRFGAWARSYAVFCYLLTQMARTGTIVFLLALAVSPLLGWSVEVVIVVTGVLMTAYTLLGGMEAVIWVGVVNSVVLLAGPLVCLIALLLAMPEGVGQLFRVAVEHDKFSLGSWGPSLSDSTFWVVLAYGVSMNLGNFAVDQGFVQRYITARSDRAAKQSVWLGAILYVPLAALFFFLGTGLFALYTVVPEWLPGSVDAARHADRVFPHFIVSQLPAGLAGLVIASIFAAAMDPSLNSMATLTLCDVYQRYLRPRASPREALWVLRLATLAWGTVSTFVALAMVQVRSVLDVWWELAGIFSGGLLGLFLLGMLSRRAGTLAALCGVAMGVFVILWITLSPRGFWPQSLSWARSPFPPLLATVLGTLTVLGTGGLLARLSRRSPPRSG